MVYEAEAGSQRWLLKAIRDSSGEVFSQLDGASDREASWRPSPNQWCLKEITAHLRDADRLSLAQIEAVLGAVDSYLPDEALDLLPAERNYLDEDLHSLLYDFADARQELLWSARSLTSLDWDKASEHRYRGRVSIGEIVRSAHQHDLEHLYQCQRLRQSFKDH